MNEQVKTSIVYMEKDELRKLVSEVKETIATEVEIPATKNFRAIDLWRIQKT